MKTIIVTGPIGAGKSFVSGLLNERGIPVYDCDAAAKALYAVNPALAAMVTDDIFSSSEKLAALENALFPLLMDDFLAWAAASSRDFVAMESATILQKPFFDGFGDYVILVTAPVQTRLERVMSRGGISRQSALDRMALQQDQTDNPRVSCIIDNAGDKSLTINQTEKFLKSINYYGNTEN